MKTLQFGFSSVAATRVVNHYPQLIVNSTKGGMRLTAPLTRALGLQHGDHVMFVNNIPAIDQAILEGDESLVNFCEEQGLEFGTPEASIAIHKEFDVWCVAKGIQEFTEKGEPRKQALRLTKKDRMSYVAANFNEMLATANEQASDEIKDILFRDGVTKEEQVETLAQFVQADQTNRYRGSRAYNNSGITGIGAPLAITDSNIWHTLKSDLGEEATTVNRVFSVDVDAVFTLPVFDGFKEVTTAAVPLGSYVDKVPARQGGEDEEEETV